MSECLLNEFEGARILEAPALGHHVASVSAVGRSVSSALKDSPSPELLLEEFLKPMGITQYRLAKEIGVPQRRIGEIAAGARAVTADTGLRLSRFFNMSDGFWIGLQMDYDAAMAKDALAKVLAKIEPWPIVEQHGENDTEPGASVAGSRRGRTR